MVQEINRDYQAQIDTIQAETDHQELLFTGSRATWPEILSVYAVMVVTDPEAPREVVTMTPENRQFWRAYFGKCMKLPPAPFTGKKVDKGW